MSSKIIASTTSGTALNMSADTSGVLEIQTGSGPTTAITVDSSQNVGIGTTSPTVYGFYKTLEVRGTGGGLLQFGTGTATAAYLYQDGTNAGFTNISNGVLSFATNNTERMRIDSSGNLLVGTTTNNTTSKINAIATSGVINGIGVYCTTTASTGAMPFFNPNGQVGAISVSGSTTTYGTSSDYRLKENVASMQNALNVVQQLKPVTYSWKADGTNGQGFIAHELAEICPQAVVGEKDAVDAQGNPVYQGIDTSFLVATLTAAIQEQQAMITALQADVAALKGKA